MNPFVFLANCGTMNSYCEVTVSRTLRGYHFSVHAHAGFPQGAFERFQRNERDVRADDRDMLVAMVEGLVQTVEKDYGVKFDTGEAAMDRRQYLFAVDPGVKRRALSRMQDRVFAQLATA